MASRKRARRQRLEPYMVNATTWFYVTSQHFEFIRELRAEDGRYIRTEAFRVRTQMLANALADLGVAKAVR